MMGPKNFLLQLLLVHLGLYGLEVYGDNGDLGDLIGDDDKKTSSPDRSFKKRIVGGQVTKENQFIWMAYLNNLTDGDIIGGATVLTVRHVLTAGHNVLKLKGPQELEVVVGVHNISTDRQSNEAQMLKVDKLILHPNFPKGGEAEDIAIVIVSSDIQFNDYVGPVYLPSRKYDLINKFVTALGWGDVKCGVCSHKENDDLTDIEDDFTTCEDDASDCEDDASDCEDDASDYEDDASDYVDASDCEDDDWHCEEESCQGIRTDTLHSARLKIVEPKYCCQSYTSKLFSVKKATQLCTWACDQDTCKGDSGGPLLYLADRESRRYVQVGVISGGACQMGVPSYSTDVFSFMSWIEDTVGMYQPPLTLQKL